MRWAWVVLLAACGGAVQRPRAAGPADLTVMTYNVNFGLEGDEQTLGAIGRGGADVVLLQETTPGWEEKIGERLGDRYTTRRFHHAGGAGGLAVLSRFPVPVLRVMPAEVGWFAAMRVVVRAPRGPVQVLNVHLRPAISNGGSVVSGAYTTPRVRRSEIERFYRHVDRSLPTLVVGDLNEGSAGRAVAFLEAQGLTDVVRDRSTWRWPTRFGTLRLALDHVFCNGLLRPRWARVVRAGRSDHLPIVAAFDLVGGRN